jgi:hypothetical protein
VSSEEAVQRVRDLHKRVLHEDDEWCAECWDRGVPFLEWPCPTIQAIDAAMDGER